MIPPNPTAKLWLFDFDNTLAALECEVDWSGSRRELEAYLRSEGVDEPIFAEIPKGNLPLYSVLHSRWLRSSADSVASPPRSRAEALLRHSSEIIERHELLGAERAMPACGAIDLLRALAARAAVSIVVTSNSSRTVARWLDRHDVADLVHAIVGRDSLLALKPSPEMVACALALATTFAAEALASSSAADNVFVHRSGASVSRDPDLLSDAKPPAAADAVFVGDSLADLDAARAAGLGFYGIATIESARDRLLAAAATDIFASPAALRIYLNL